MSEPGGSEAIGRLVRAVDFERVLGTRSRASSTHFAVHHVAGAPTPPARRLPKVKSELSTSAALLTVQPVDDSSAAGACSVARDSNSMPCGRRWFGAVVPKRHARRAVTRSLLKRQIRAAAQRHGSELAAGLWVVRLRAPFDRAEFPSAASAALQQAARAELEAVFARAATPASSR